VDAETAGSRLEDVLTHALNSSAVQMPADVRLPIMVDSNISKKPAQSSVSLVG
jgi:hypothetical protein